MKVKMNNTVMCTILKNRKKGEKKYVKIDELINFHIFFFPLAFLPNCLEPITLNLNLYIQFIISNIFFLNI